MRATHRVGAIMLVLLLGLSCAIGAQNALTPATGYSADELYNLANAYARAGKSGMAVLNYERAALLAPEDPDIAANLALVRAASGLPAPRRAWPRRAATCVSPALAAWLAVAGLLIGGVGLLAARFSPRLCWLSRVAVLLGAALIGLTVANGLAMASRLRLAIVLVAATPARATPAPLGDPLFTLPEGATVKTLGEHEDFVLVESEPATRGWVSRASLGTLIPEGAP